MLTVSRKIRVYYNKSQFLKRINSIIALNRIYFHLNGTKLIMCNFRVKHAPDNCVRIIFTLWNLCLLCITFGKFGNGSVNGDWNECSQFMMKIKLTKSFF